MKCAYALLVCTIFLHYFHSFCKSHPLDFKNILSLAASLSFKLFSPMPNFKKEIGKAKHFYFNIWRGNEKPCPAFSGEVVRASQAGWKHIRYSDRRNKKQVIPRLKLLPAAKLIIEGQTNYNEYRKVGKYEYWSIEDFINGKRVRFVIRSINCGPKHFFSVFVIKKDKNKKAPLSLGPK